MLQRPDLTVDVIAENVIAVELRESLAPINNATDDALALGLTCAPRVLINRIQIVRKSRWNGASHGRCGVSAFAEDPAVVASPADDVDLLVSLLAHIAQVKQAGGVIERKPERIAQTDGPKFRPHRGRSDGQTIELGRAHEWIIIGDPIGVR